jgi:sugar/nucleoside kinase (ribokinase family)
MEQVVSRAALDVTGIGNAIVDIIFPTDDATIIRLDMSKAAMTLISLERSEQLRQLNRPRLQLSGGSAGNTIAGLASLGAKVGYIGKIGDDELGDVFRHDMTSMGVQYRTPPAIDGPPTAHCMIFVTQDAQRTMNTYLGACVNLTVQDLDREMIETSSILYLEGYLFDPPNAQDAFRAAAHMAHAAGRQVALTLSDSLCVQRHRRAFLDLVENHVDILFANEMELKALFDTEVWDEAVACAAPKVRFAAITRGSLGSIIAAGRRIISIPPVRVASVVDTTGAGDLYASGVMFGLATGRSPEECGWFGSVAAAEIISHFGGRPEVSLKDHLASRSIEMPTPVRYAQIQRSR